jgi:hypothetical protein
MKKNLKEMKWHYFEASIWHLSIEPAFKRNRIYNAIDIEDETKANFRELLHEEVLRMFELYREPIPVSEENHIDNIVRLSNKSKKFKNILQGGKLNIGTCQKILNLYLKQMWCAGIMKNEPPHFPVDRIIQQLLGIFPIIPWTGIDTTRAYRGIIKEAKKIANKSNCSIAELELKLFSEKSSIS